MTKQDEYEQDKFKNLPKLKAGFQRYATNGIHGWTVLDANIPCNAGEGIIIAKNLTDEEVKHVLKHND